MRLLARKFGWVEDVDKWSLYVDKWSSYLGSDYMKDMRTFAGKYQWKKEERWRKEQESGRWRI